jgi:DNA-binding NarL/FixJ family response regulator
MLIRVALVDDQQHIHDAVQAVLRAVDDITLVGQAYGGEDALGLCQRTQPDIMLMDVVMPTMNGAEATQQVLGAFPALKVLVLSSFREYEYIKAMLDSGAVGYLVKDAIAQDLVPTLRSTASGNTVLSPDVVQTLLNPTAPANDFGLTERELEVLQAMASGQTYTEIARALHISNPTVRFHVNNLLHKFNVVTRSEVLVLAARHGLV